VNDKKKLLPVHGLDGVKITALGASPYKTLAISGMYYSPAAVRNEKNNTQI